MTTGRGGRVNEVLSLAGAVDPSHHLHQPLLHILQVSGDGDSGEDDIAFVQVGSAFLSEIFRLHNNCCGPILTIPCFLQLFSEDH